MIWGGFLDTWLRHCMDGWVLFEMQHSRKGRVEVWGMMNTLLGMQGIAYCGKMSARFLICSLHFIFYLWRLHLQKLLEKNSTCIMTVNLKCCMCLMNGGSGVFSALKNHPKTSGAKGEHSIMFMDSVGQGFWLGAIVQCVGGIRGRETWYWMCWVNTCKEAICLDILYPMMLPWLVAAAGIDQACQNAKPFL